MKRFYADSYASIAFRLSRLIAVIEASDARFSDEGAFYESIRSDAEWLMSDSERLGLDTTKAGAQRLMSALTEPVHSTEHIRDCATYVMQSLQDQLQSRVVVLLEPDKVPLAFEPHQFGEQVDLAFPSAAWDIEEAARCMAFDRWTAAVFHLMRVAEMSAVTLGRRIGYQSPKEGFGEVLRYMDNALKDSRDNYKNAASSFKGNIEFLSTVTAHMHAVNQAWRQRVSHMEKKYTQEEAMRVWDATKGLVQHLATQLNDEAQEITQ